MSPDGTYLAAIHTNAEGAGNLVTMDLETNAVHAVTAFELGGVVDYIWKNDDRFIFWGAGDSQAAGRSSRG